jgi:hypothetical protein
MATYAVINNDLTVIDIIEFDVLSGSVNPYEETTLIKVGEPTPTPIPTIGQKWNGEINEFE